MAPKRKKGKAGTTSTSSSSSSSGRKATKASSPAPSMPGPSASDEVGPDVQCAICMVRPASAVTLYIIQIYNMQMLSIACRMSSPPFFFQTKKYFRTPWWFHLTKLALCALALCAVRPYRIPPRRRTSPALMVASISFVMAALCSGPTMRQLVLCVRSSSTSSIGSPSPRRVRLPRGRGERPRR